MARTRYSKKPQGFERIQYTGDLQALRDFGLTLTNTDYANVHVAIRTHQDDGRLCPIGHYIVKSDDGEIEIVAPDKFDAKYEQRP